MTDSMNADLAEKVYKAVQTAADMAAIDAGNRGETQAEIVGAAVKAAFEAALGNGIIRVMDDSEWPVFFVLAPPYSAEAAFMHDANVRRPRWSK